MLNFLGNQIIFYISLILVLFLPGYFLLNLIEIKRKYFSLLEKFVIAFGLSIIAVDFLMLLINRTKIPLTRSSVLAGIVFLILICWGIEKIFRKNKGSEAENKIFDFSKKQIALVMLLLFLTVFIKTAYLKYNVLPSTTDMGHHMFWANTIVQTGAIPDYSMRDIANAGGDYTIGQPQPISDFIIGEHLIFAAIKLISGLDFISYFPVIALHLINIISILAIFILALRLFEDRPRVKNIAIAALFFIGPLFAVAPPQAKYSGGGVIGNVIGNLLLPLTFYFFYRALREKNNLMLLLALVFSMGLFYTHHLTGFLFLLIFALIFLAIIIIHIRELWSFFRLWLKIIITPPIVMFVILAPLFVLAVYTPTYLTNKAVTTVVGGPTKVDHTGLAFSDFKFTLGEPRVALSIAGIIMFLLLALKIFKQKSYREIFLFAWIFIIAIISLKSGWIGVDIPSSRVANYGAYPLSIIAAFAVVQMVDYLRKKEVKNAHFIDKKVFIPALILLVTFAVTAGFYDNSSYAARSSDAQKTVETFEAAKYLAQKTGASDQIVTDHVYVASDSWIKLFFMRGYNFPLYRANLDRYSNGIDKQEQCTLWMISTPESADSQKCYQDLSIDYVLVNKKFDAPQFENAGAFWQIYSNGELTGYYRLKI